MAYNVDVRDLDSIPLAVIRGQAKQSELPRVVPDWCGRVWKAVRAQQTPAGRNVAIYWDGAIRLEVGVELHGPFAETDDVVISQTPSGRVACVTHLGPYSQLRAANDAIKDWCRANNHGLAGPSWEIYGHWQKDWDLNPAQIRTDVFWLLR